jgi:hypothetical protein
MKITVYWNITPRSSKKARRFGGIYRLNLQGLGVNKARNKQLPLASAGFLIGVMFNGVTSQKTVLFISTSVY